MKFKYSAIGFALLGGLLATTNTAAAATCTVNANGGQKINYTLDLATAAQCASGNDTNQINPSYEVFGLTGWILADKNDDATSGDQMLSFDGSPANGDKSGIWSILNSSGYSNVFISLKAGNGFGAFLLSGSDFLNGTWATSKDLSHASIYYQGEPSPSAVPVPAAGFLLAGALGALVLRRRKKV